MTTNTALPARAGAPRIVAGVDPSDHAARAAAWAAREAVARGLSLHLVNALELPSTAGLVVEPPGYATVQAEAGRELLDRVAGELRASFPGLAVTAEISEVGAAQTLVTLSQDARLVVTGTRGHGGFTGMLLGSVSHAVAAHAHCPAVVVRGEEPAEPLGEIVVGVEPGEAEAPIRFAFETGAAVGTSVTFVRAWWPPMMYGGYGAYYALASLDFEAIEAGECTDVQDLVRPIRDEFPQVKASVRVTRGNPVPILDDAALGSRLLVVGARRRRGPLSVGIGQITLGLLAHSPTPVAIVPIG